MQFQHADSGGFGVDEEAAEAQAMAMMGQGVLSPARVASGPKVGRNDPCPCGSGKKFKQCHGQLT
jgi:preprotein translocase subunit SecA